MSLLIVRALLFAGECFLASLLLPLLAFAVTVTLRRRAALRHLVWTTLFGVLAVLPLVALALPPRLIVEHLAAPAAAMPPMVAAVTLAPAPPPSLFTLENGVLALVVLWLAGLAWQLLRMAIGGLGLLRLRHASVAFPAGIEPGCDVRLSHDECGPSTFGILHPVVLLPRSAQSWSVARLDAVLRHEAAHVVRRDAASQFVARLVCSVYWLNPLLWLALSALRRAAEIAADDAVLASGMTPSLYAEELVRLAAENRGLASPIPFGIAMARPPLTARVHSILETTTTRTGVSRMDIAKTVSFGLAATLLLGVARFDIAVAQDAPAPLMQADAAQEKLLHAEAEKAAVDATSALAHAEAARKAAQDVASTQIRRAMTRVGSPEDAVAATRSLAAMEQAERAARDVASARVGEAMRLAQAAPGQAESHASASSSQDSESSTNGVITVRRTHQGDGKDDNDAAQARRDAMARAMDVQRQAMKAMADAHIDQQVAKAMADAHVSETIAKALADAHVDETTRKAIADAHIEQRIAEAMAQVQPQIDAAARAARRMPALPAIAPVPPLPAPPAPAALPVPPVPVQ